MTPQLTDVREATVRLWECVDAFDAESADILMADLLWKRPLDQAVMEIVLPLLEEVGDRWEDGRLSVAHEHFVSNLVRRWLWGFASRPAAEDRPEGPVVLLACPPGESHDLVLLCFALLLAENGARTRFLGADTPIAAIVAAARSANADAVVLASTRDTALTAATSAISRLALEHPVFVAGRGATQLVAEDLRAHRLPHDPVAAVGFLRAVLKR